ncbi:PREDICTED: uncharacterized protein LOC109593089 [Amphimedon queenslandica]|uniref:Uncharacterized protein n=1 Tax=Amphimedon queenslandica TaxID=400682 RepID=A0AAN0K2W7_AMPQE|nr:PREDICTED: uncharacterized protein LOC109593089 [Amphimedon queenslandica]|eukprot:XP_019863892.1 PREDICTED: uncharacterized protein LOC109593089 [Amphimedon queenslandica]
MAVSFFNHGSLMVFLVLLAIADDEKSNRKGDEDIRLSMIQHLSTGYMKNQVVSSSSPLISSTSVTSFNIMPTASISSDLYISSTHFMSPTPSNKSSSRSSLLISGTLISNSNINFLIPSAPLSSHISSDILCSTVSNCCRLVISIDFA